MAIDDLLDEHEQSERVRSWLRNNAAGLIGGIVLGLGLIGGWQWWQRHQLQQRVDANAHYHVALQAIAAGDLATAQLQVAALSDDLYASLASLELARTQVAAGERDAAIVTLRATSPSDPALAQVVALRLAHLLIAADKPDEALALLGDTEQPAALEARGDAQFALGRAEQAREEYSQALTRLDVGAPQRGLLELKLTAVGGTPAQPEAES